ncbi:MAG TPA: glycosyltransferase [Gemmatimonadaceae bacterium]|nr:glycosyltransferase [Gemmatimonadaceae bacterium]
MKGAFATAPQRTEAKDDGAAGQLGATANAPLRVLLACDKLGIENARLHGAGRLVIDWTRALLDRGVEVTPVILRAAGTLGDEVHAAGLPFVFLNRSRYDPRTLWDFVLLIRRHRVQLLHLQGFGSSLFGRIAAWLTGTRSIVHVHADHRQETGGYPLLVRWIDRALAARTDHVLTISSSVTEFATEAQGFRAEQITVCLSPIDRSRFRCATDAERSAARATFEIPPHAPVAVCVARFDAVKGVDVLVDAWARVAAELPDAMLLLVGDGPQREALEQQVAGTSWMHSVRFAGYRSDVEIALWASDVAVVPSRYDGLSLAALEAMAAGLPVVASRIGGIPEIVRDEMTGVLVPPETPDALACALIALLGDADRRRHLGVAAAHASMEHDLAEFAEQLEGIYGRVVARSVT